MRTAKCSCCEAAVQSWVTLWSRDDVFICYECLYYLNSRRARQTAIRGGLKPEAGYDPVFSVLDMLRAVDHYQRLGFMTHHHDDTYAFAKWGGSLGHPPRARGGSATTLEERALRPRRRHR